MPGACPALCWALALTLSEVLIWVPSSWPPTNPGSPPSPAPGSTWAVRPTAPRAGLHGHTVQRSRIMVSGSHWRGGPGPGLLGFESIFVI